MSTAKREDSVGGADSPEHAGLFEAMADDGLAAGFDDAGANEQVLLAKLGVLNPSGATGMFIGKNDASQRRAREVVYYPSGAYSLNVERFDSHGGWIASPIDLVRFLVRVDGESTKVDILSAASRTTMVTKAGILDGNGNDPNYGFGWANNPQSHNGATSGTIAILAKAQNGFTYAVVANTRPANDGFAGNMSAIAQSIISSVSTWPAYDLF